MTAAVPWRRAKRRREGGEGRVTEREVVGGLRRIPRAVGSDGSGDGDGDGGGVDPCTAI